MKSFKRLQASALASTATIAFAFATPAYAQETQEETPPPEALTTEQEVESGQKTSTEEAIVVTGLRIRQPNLESVVPVTSIGGQEFLKLARPRSATR